MKSLKQGLEINLMNSNVSIVVKHIIPNNIETGNFYIISIEIACLYRSKTLCFRLVIL